MLINRTSTRKQNRKRRDFFCFVKFLKKKMDSKFNIPTILIISTMLSLMILNCVLCVPPEQPIAGGISKANPADFNLIVPSLTALEREMDGKMDSPYVHRVGEITEGSIQVVAGLRFYVTFNFGQTSCLKNATGLVVEQCNEILNNRQCYADIWSQSWTNTNQLLEFRCN